MLEYIKKSVWARLFACSVICTLISFVLVLLTDDFFAAYALMVFFSIFAIFTLLVTIYLMLKKAFNFGKLVSLFIFFAFLAGLLFVCNMIYPNEYLDMAWQCSLLIGGIAILLQVVLLFFGKKQSVTVQDSTENEIIKVDNSVQSNEAERENENNA